MKRLKQCNLNFLLHNPIFLFFSAFSTALCFVMDLNVPDTAESGITNSLYLLVYKLIETIQIDLTAHGLTLTVLTLLFFLVYRNIWQLTKEVPVKYSRILAAVFSIGYTAGIGFAYDNSLLVLVTSTIRLLKTCFFLLGMYMLYLSVINVFYNLCIGYYSWNIKKNKFSNLLSGNTRLISWLIIFASWLIHMVLRYPGIMSYDNYNQLAYYFHYCSFTTAQPIFHTWLFGSFVKLGLLIGSENLGLFLFIIFQSIIMSVILAWSLSLMKKYQTPDWLFYLTLGIYCIAPYYSGYASFPVKDYLYTAFFVLLILLQFEWNQDIKTFYNNKTKPISWIIAASMLMMCRNNGIYIYIPMVAIMACMLLKRLSWKHIHKKIAITALITLMAPFFISSLINGTITTTHNVEKDSPKEMFSLPFQQTARYVREYGDEVTEEEKQAIAEVLDYENLASLYNEMTSDPVKTTYHADDTSELIAYFKVWLGQFIKHPMCYLEATWNQNYYLLAPNIDNIVYNKDCRTGHEIMYEYGLLEDIDFQVPDVLHGMCTIMVSFYSLLTKLPVIGLLNNVAFYMILMFTVMAFACKDKCQKLYPIIITLLLAFVFILLSPQIQNQPRYAFPIIYSMPSFVAFYIYSLKK